MVSTPAEIKAFVLNEASFHEAMAVAKRSFSKDPDAFNSDDDEAKDNCDPKSEPSADVIPNDDEQRDKTATENLSLPPPIACTSRPVRSCSIKSQKQISDYYRKK